jgi:hypothetical protein
LAGGGDVGAHQFRVLSVEERKAPHAKGMRRFLEPGNMRKKHEEDKGGCSLAIEITPAGMAQFPVCRLDRLPA